MKSLRDFYFMRAAARMLLFRERDIIGRKKRRNVNVAFLLFLFCFL